MRGIACSRMMGVVVRVKQSVTLKGVKDGFILYLDEAASFASIVEELERLLEHLYAEETSKAEKKEINLDVTSGNRLLSEEEENKITDMISSKSRFTFQKIKSDVLTYEKALAWQKQVSLQMEVRTVRSGQILSVQGDILFVGKVQPGGSIRANGSIFILGELHGVAHAGFEGDSSAVVIADFHTNAQVRIADSVHIIEQRPDENKEVHKNEFAYINDLHILDFKGLDHLKEIRPNLGKLKGGLI